MLDYDAAMATGQAAYQDALDVLKAEGLPGTFTQTGGMCAALEVALEAGCSLLLTEADGPLAWDRAEHSGWGVGLYGPGRRHEEPLAFDCTTDGSVDILPSLVRSVLASSRAISADAVSVGASASGEHGDGDTRSA